MGLVGGRREREARGQAWQVASSVEVIVGGGLDVSIETLKLEGERGTCLDVSIENQKLKGERGGEKNRPPWFSFLCFSLNLALWGVFRVNLFWLNL